MTKTLNCFGWKESKPPHCHCILGPPKTKQHMITARVFVLHVFAGLVWAIHEVLQQTTSVT